MVQVNGKTRAKIQIAANASQAEIEATALAQENVQRHLEGHAVKKVIIVPNKLVNIVGGKQ